MKLLAAIGLLAAASLACTQAVQIPTATPLPSPTDTARPTLRPSPSPTAEVDTATVASAAVNVRAEPAGAVIGSLEAGDTVTVTECADSWCKIEQPFEGYIWQGCLSDNPTKLGCQAE